ncbi:MAG TPA: hypothetical protein VMN99_01320, partial [Anaerolineales bacterium]|nr:hypothetical protein [Anaerolineales bacterium]
MLTSCSRERSSSRTKPARTLSSVMWGIIPPIILACTPPNGTLSQTQAFTFERADSIYPT